MLTDHFLGRYTFISQREIPEWLSPAQKAGRPIKMFWWKDGSFFGWITCGMLHRMREVPLVVCGAIRNDLPSRLYSVVVYDLTAFRERFRWQFGDSWEGFCESSRAARYKYCGGCNRDLRATRFRQLHGPERLDARCQNCRRIEKKREASRSLVMRDVRMAHAEGSHTEAQWQAVLIRFDNRCVCCGIRASETKYGHLSKDHIVPIVRNGSDFISNIQPLCGSCNSRKGKRTIDYRDNPFTQTPSILPESVLPGQFTRREVR
jgi:5-methylcytosine-specific restriction endonuclease McrA